LDRVCVLLPDPGGLPSFLLMGCGHHSYQFNQFIEIFRRADR